MDLVCLNKTRPPAHKIMKTTKMIILSLVCLLCSCEKNYKLTTNYDTRDVASVQVFILPGGQEAKLNLNGGRFQLKIPEKVVDGVRSLKIVFHSKKYGILEHVENAVIAQREVEIICEDGKIRSKLVSVGYY